MIKCTSSIKSMNKYKLESLCNLASLEMLEGVGRGCKASVEGKEGVWGSRRGVAAPNLSLREDN